VCLLLNAVEFHGFWHAMGDNKLPFFVWKVHAISNINGEFSFADKVSASLMGFLDKILSALEARDDLLCGFADVE